MKKILSLSVLCFFILCFSSCEEDTTIEMFAVRIEEGMNRNNDMDIIEYFDFKELKKHVRAMSKFPYGTGMVFDKVAKDMLDKDIMSLKSEFDFTLLTSKEFEKNKFKVVYRMDNDASVNYIVFYVLKKSKNVFVIYDLYNVWIGDRVSASINKFLTRKTENSNQFDINLTRLTYAKSKLESGDIEEAYNQLNQIDSIYAYEHPFILLRTEVISQMNMTMLEDHISAMILRAKRIESQLLYKAALAGFREDHDAYADAMIKLEDVLTE